MSPKIGNVAVDFIPQDRVSRYIASLFNISFFSKREDSSTLQVSDFSMQSENLTKENKHVPIMQAEVMDALKVRPDWCYIDCTFGAGGHTKAMLDRGAIVYSLDRDASAFEYAKDIESNKFFYQHTSFANIENVWNEEIAPLKVDGVFFDLGFSSNQIENAQRGFSFTRDGQLDMRFDLEQEHTAQTWLNTANEEEIANVFFHYGQERNSKTIAKAIVKTRKKSAVKTTFDLVKIIEEHNKFDHKHAATRIFQAIRIHINDEFTHIQRALHGARKILKQHGRLAVLTFHSLEDKIVKNFFENEVNFIMFPSEKEIKQNPRARSAKLRWMIKTEEV